MIFKKNVTLFITIVFVLNNFLMQVYTFVNAVESETNNNEEVETSLEDDSNDISGDNNSDDSFESNVFTGNLVGELLDTVSSTVTLEELNKFYGKKQEIDQLSGFQLQLDTLTTYLNTNETDLDDQQLYDLFFQVSEDSWKQLILEKELQETKEGMGLLSAEGIQEIILEFEFDELLIGSELVLWTGNILDNNLIIIDDNLNIEELQKLVTFMKTLDIEINSDNFDELGFLEKIKSYSGSLDTDSIRQIVTNIQVDYLEQMLEFKTIETQLENKRENISILSDSGVKEIINLELEGVSEFTGNDISSWSGDVLIHNLIEIEKQLDVTELNQLIKVYEDLGDFDEMAFLEVMLEYQGNLDIAQVRQIVLNIDIDDLKSMHDFKQQSEQNENIGALDISSDMEELILFPHGVYSNTGSLIKWTGDEFVSNIDIINSKLSLIDLELIKQLSEEYRGNMSLDNLENLVNAYEGVINIDDLKSIVFNLEQEDIDYLFMMKNKSNEIGVLDISGDANKIILFPELEGEFTGDVIFWTGDSIEENLNILYDKLDVEELESLKLAIENIGTFPILEEGTTDLTEISDFLNDNITSVIDSYQGSIDIGDLRQILVNVSSEDVQQIIDLKELEDSVENKQEEIGILSDSENASIILFTGNIYAEDGGVSLWDENQKKTNLEILESKIEQIELEKLKSIVNQKESLLTGDNIIQEIPFLTVIKNYDGKLLVDDIKQIIVNLSVEDIDFVIEWKQNKETVKEEQKEIALMAIADNTPNIPEYYDGMEDNINDYLLWYFYRTQNDNGSWGDNIEETFWNIYFLKSAGLQKSHIIIDNGLKYLSSISTHNNIEKIIRIWAKKELDYNIETDIQNLGNYQNLDGGFSIGDYYQSDIYTSIYALLIEEGDVTSDIDDTNLLNYIRTYINNGKLYIKNGNKQNIELALYFYLFTTQDDNNEIIGESLSLLKENILWNLKQLSSVQIEKLSKTQEFLLKTITKEITAEDIITINTVDDYELMDENSDISGLEIDGVTNFDITDLGVLFMAYNTVYNGEYDDRIVSTRLGGNWGDPATWVEGIVPTETDNVQILGTVKLGDFVTTNNIIISEGARLINGDSYWSNLQVNGDIINNGSLEVEQMEETRCRHEYCRSRMVGGLWVESYGDILNEGNINVNSINLMGDETRTIDGNQLSINRLRIGGNFKLNGTLDIAGSISFGNDSMILTAPATIKAENIYGRRPVNIGGHGGIITSLGRSNVKIEGTLGKFILDGGGEHEVRGKYEVEEFIVRENNTIKNNRRARNPEILDISGDLINNGEIKQVKTTRTRCRRSRYRRRRRRSRRYRRYRTRRCNTKTYGGYELKIKGGIENSGDILVPKITLIGGDNWQSNPTSIQTTNPISADIYFLGNHNLQGIGRFNNNVYFADNKLILQDKMTIGNGKGNIEIQNQGGELEILGNYDGKILGGLDKIIWNGQKQQQAKGTFQATTLEVGEGTSLVNQTRLDDTVILLGNLVNNGIIKKNVAYRTGRRLGRTRRRSRRGRRRRRYRRHTYNKPYGGYSLSVKGGIQNNGVINGIKQIILLGTDNWETKATNINSSQPINSRIVFQGNHRLSGVANWDNVIFNDNQIIVEDKLILKNASGNIHVPVNGGEIVIKNNYKNNITGNLGKITFDGQKQQYIKGIYEANNIEITDGTTISNYKRETNTLELQGEVLNNGIIKRQSDNRWRCNRRGYRRSRGCRNLRYGNYIVKIAGGIENNGEVTIPNLYLEERSGWESTPTILSGINSIGSRIVFLGNHNLTGVSNINSYVRWINNTIRLDDVLRIKSMYGNLNIKGLGTLETDEIYGRGRRETREYSNISWIDKGNLVLNGLMKVNINNPDQVSIKGNGDININEANQVNIEGIGNQYINGTIKAGKTIVSSDTILGNIPKINNSLIIKGEFINNGTIKYNLEYGLKRKLIGRRLGNKRRTWREAIGSYNLTCEGSLTNNGTLEASRLIIRGIGTDINIQTLEPINTKVTLEGDFALENDVEFTQDVYMRNPSIDIGTKLTVNNVSGTANIRGNEFYIKGDARTNILGTVNKILINGNKEQVISGKYVANEFVVETGTIVQNANYKDEILKIEANFTNNGEIRKNPRLRYGCRRHSSRYGYCSRRCGNKVKGTYTIQTYENIDNKGIWHPSMTILEGNMPREIKLGTNEGIVQLGNDLEMVGESKIGGTLDFNNKSLILNVPTNLEVKTLKGKTVINGNGGIITLKGNSNASIKGNLGNLVIDTPSITLRGEYELNQLEIGENTVLQNPGSQTSSLTIRGNLVNKGIIRQNQTKREVCRRRRRHRYCRPVFVGGYNINVGGNIQNQGEWIGKIRNRQTRAREETDKIAKVSVVWDKVRDESIGGQLEIEGMEYEEQGIVEDLRNLWKIFMGKTKVWVGDRQEELDLVRTDEETKLSVDEYIKENKEVQGYIENETGEKVAEFCIGEDVSNCSKREYTIDYGNGIKVYTKKSPTNVKEKVIVYKDNVEREIFIFNEQGKLVEGTMKDENGDMENVIGFDYDEMGRIKEETSKIGNGETQTTRYSYEGNNLLLTYPSGREVTRVYDEDKMLIKINEGGEELMNWIYENLEIDEEYSEEQLEQIKQSMLDINQQTNSLTNLLTGAQIEQDSKYKYEYDYKGNLIKVTSIETADILAIYSYDVLGRRNQKILGDIETVYTYAINTPIVEEVKENNLLKEKREIVYGRNLYDKVYTYRNYEKEIPIMEYRDIVTNLLEEDTTEDGLTQEEIDGGIERDDGISEEMFNKIKNLFEGTNIGTGSIGGEETEVGTEMAKDVGTGSVENYEILESGEWVVVGYEKKWVTERYWYLTYEQEELEGVINEEGEIWVNDDSNEDEVLGIYYLGGGRYYVKESSIVQQNIWDDIVNGVRGGIRDGIEIGGEFVVEKTVYLRNKTPEGVRVRIDGGGKLFVGTLESVGGGAATVGGTSICVGTWGWGCAPGTVATVWGVNEMYAGGTRIIEGGTQLWYGVRVDDVYDNKIHNVIDATVKDPVWNKRLKIGNDTGDIAVGGWKIFKEFPTLVKKLRIFNKFKDVENVQDIKRIAKENIWTPKGLPTGGATPVNGTYSDALAIVEGLKSKGWVDITTENARSLGITVISKGEQKINLRNFGHSDEIYQEAGFKVNATLDVFTESGRKTEIKFLTTK